MSLAMPDDTAVRRILVVDDEHIMCELLQFNLENAGYEVDVCYSAEDALKIDLASYDLLLLDVMMGDMSGLTLAQKVKSSAETENIPIIFCSAKDCDEDVVLGLNCGADDYVKKPFSMREMVARVQNVLRRQSIHKRTSRRLVFEGLVLDLTARTVDVDGVKTMLTRTEFELLALLMQNQNRFFSRNEIFDNVWPQEVIVTDRTVDVNISRLRKKLGKYSSNIVNRSGFGYAFVD